MSVTQKNTYVDKIATIIQTSRLLIKQDNEEVCFTSDEIRKIILLHPEHIVNVFSKKDDKKTGHCLNYHKL